MPSVVIVNAVYPPEPVVSAQIGRDLAARLIQQGAQVTVLCPFPTRPVGARYSEFRSNGRPVAVREGGVDVVRLPSYTAPESSFPGRMHESFSFGWHAADYIRKTQKGVDVVYANVWPVLGQAILARTCSRLGIPMVLHIQDIYPEALLAKLPRIFARVVAPALRMLDRWTVRKAAALVVISQQMARVYAEDRRVADDRIQIVPNWQNEELFIQVPDREEACRRYNISPVRFAFLYMGNIGPVAGVELLIKAFYHAGLNNAQLIIGGDGSAKADCVAYAASLGAKNIHFLSDPDVRNVPLIQSLADVFLLPVKKGAGMSSIPSKLMAYLFSGKPVLATIDSDSDTARCIREARCGWVGAPEDPDWLSAKMAEIASMKHDILQTMGAEGKAYGLLHFSKSKGVGKLSGVVLQASTRRLSP